MRVRELVEGHVKPQEPQPIQCGQLAGLIRKAQKGFSGDAPHPHRARELVHQTRKLLQERVVLLAIFAKAKARISDHAREQINAQKRLEVFQEELAGGRDDRARGYEIHVLTGLRTRGHRIETQHVFERRVFFEEFDHGRVDFPRDIVPHHWHVVGHLGQEPVGGLEMVGVEAQRQRPRPVFKVRHQGLFEAAAFFEVGDGGVFWSGGFGAHVQAIEMLPVVQAARELLRGGDLSPVAKRIGGGIHHPPDLNSLLLVGQAHAGATLPPMSGELIVSDGVGFLEMIG